MRTAIDPTLPPTLAQIASTGGLRIDLPEPAAWVTAHRAFVAHFEELTRGVRLAAGSGPEERWYWVAFDPGRCDGPREAARRLAARLWIPAVSLVRAFPGDWPEVRPGMRAGAIGVRLSYALLWRHERIARESEAVGCSCGGRARRAGCTEDEIYQYGCGRDRVGAECCARAFVCALCGRRYACKVEAPEMEDFE